jgi:uncharacterized YccA/Bax inhibitor family protein
MSLRHYKTTNPVFNNYFWGGSKTAVKKMSVTGIFIKSLGCIIVIAAITAYLWKLSDAGMPMKWFTLGGMLASIIISTVLSVRYHWAPFMVPLYTIAKGCFLGGFSAYAHRHFPELPYQAIGITIITFFVMLLLYQTKIIVVTKKTTQRYSNVGCKHFCSVYNHLDIWPFRNKQLFMGDVMGRYSI